MPAKASDQPPQKPALSSSFPIVAKPWQRRFPTPRIDDYIVSVRADTRSSEFVMPKKGDRFHGVDQQKRLSKEYRFATAVPVEQLPDFVDLYYIAPFRFQEEYNFTVAYPYNDKNYPAFTRTYVALRTDSIATDEPQTDTFDPVFGKPFQLTDHKIERFTDDNVMDAIFVKITRLFERLPSPIITSFEANQYQQVVTVQTQEVVKSAPPSQSALTEAMKQERTGRAKAKNTLSSVPDVFPQTQLTTEIPSMTRELWLGGFDEESVSQVSAGQVAQPVLNTPGDYAITEDQLTEFKKRVVTKFLPLPQSRQHEEMSTEFGGGILNEYLNIDTPTSGLNIDNPGAVNTWTTQSSIRNLPGFGIIRKVVQLPVGVPWPKLQGVHVETDGIFSGITFIVNKQYVQAGSQPDGSGPPYTPNPGPQTPLGGYTEMQEHDKWRTIQLTTRVDPATLPGIGKPPIVNGTSVHIDLPAKLLGLFGDFATGSASSWSINPTSLVATADVQINANGEVGATFLEGYHGPTLAQVTTIFFLSPPTLAQLTPYRPTVIQPAIGVALIKGRVFKYGLTQQPGGQITATDESIEDRAGRISLRPAMTRHFTQPTTLVQSAPNAAAGQTGNGNDLVIFQNGSFAQATITLAIPQSVGDEALFAGNLITISSEVKEWKMGIWVLEVIQAQIPFGIAGY